MNNPQDNARNDSVEDRFYILGDARDFLDKTEPALLDMIDALQLGTMKAETARMLVRLRFRDALKDVDEWEKILTNNAIQLGYPYLRDSLKIGRVMVPLPSSGGVA